MLSLADGARGRIRTADTAIFSRMLYQLSYPGVAAIPALDRPAREWRARLWRTAAGLARGYQSSRTSSSGLAGGPGTA